MFLINIYNRAQLTYIEQIKNNPLLVESSDMK